MARNGSAANALHLSARRELSDSPLADAQSGSSGSRQRAFALYDLTVYLVLTAPKSIQKIASSHLGLQRRKYGGMESRYPSATMVTGSTYLRNRR